ncbi:MAG: hypothetical protein IPK62_02090 [Bacteroidetes bacterium]|nr:hypothetical protein [Bacteroidota bacterium]
MQRNSCFQNNIKNVKTHHFAHSSGSECEKAYETALHLLAKEIINRRKRVLLPKSIPRKNYIHESNFTKAEETITFDTVKLEKYIDEDGIIIKPDIIGIVNGREVYIEIAVTHFIDYRKFAKLKKLKKDCIQIDLSESELNEEKLIEVIENGTTYTEWITNESIEVEYKNFINLNSFQVKENIINAFKIVTEICLPRYYHSYITASKSKRVDLFDDEITNGKKFVLFGDDDIDDDELTNDCGIESTKVNFDKILSYKDEDFGSILSEINFKHIKPDFIFVKGDRYLFCKVLHFKEIPSEGYKYSELLELNIPFIVFELPRFTYNLEALMKFISNSEIDKLWMTNPREEERKRIEKERRVREEEGIMKKYIDDCAYYTDQQRFLIFEFLGQDDKYIKCPKKKEVLNQFLKTNFYNHPVLKRIIDGENWYPKIYGHYGNPHIYLNRQPIYIYEDSALTGSLFYAGLKNIIAAF